jgi:DNA ligase D-like protein (predicted 3'-phosphoesterase)
MNENEIAKEVVDAAYQVHRKLGPGLLETVYEVVLAYELKKRGVTDQKLKEYRRKRDFSKTIEPKGSIQETGRRRFSIQEHQATHLHYDLRLELDGVLKSWAIPKEPPTEAGVKRLAVQTEDHPLDYIYFEGIIPEGQYGAGIVSVWDKGQIELESREEEKIIFLLRGERLTGRYVLIHTRGNQWIFFKTK